MLFLEFHATFDAYLAFDRLYRSLSWAAQTLVRAIRGGNIQTAILLHMIDATALEEVNDLQLQLLACRAR